MGTDVLLSAQVVLLVPKGTGNPCWEKLKKIPSGRIERAKAWGNNNSTRSKSLQSLLQGPWQSLVRSPLQPPNNSQRPCQPRAQRLSFHRWMVWASTMPKPPKAPAPMRSLTLRSNRTSMKSFEYPGIINLGIKTVGYYKTPVVI